DVIASWPDLRNPVPLSVEAEFGFSKTRHKVRHYPGATDEAPPPSTVILTSKLHLEPDKRVFQGDSELSFSGESEYVAGASPYVFRPRPPDGSRIMQPYFPDPLGAARAQALRDWFVAGYGPSRLLPGAGKAARQSEPTIDRLRPLFGESPIG